MAKLTYDENGRLLFTKEMKEEYTILIPQMLPVHFAMITKCLQLEGYRCEMLNTSHRGIVDTGLKYVHNDTCFPALLVIGQLIDALESGKYDVHKCALVITQTGGGCRASNYIHLLRKALKKAGYGFVPVISINISGLEKNPGFKMGIKLMIKAVYSLVYGDLIVLLANQVRPYEMVKGMTDATVGKWVNELVKRFDQKGGMRYKSFKINMREIAADFKGIDRIPGNKPRIGVVGEIFIKYSPLGNNHLEDFLLGEDCEPVVPGIIDFIIFKIDNRAEDIGIYGGPLPKKLVVNTIMKFTMKCQKQFIDIVNEYPGFRAPPTFSHIKELVKGYLGYGNKMGEGWLLTAEMLELITSGANGVVCAQPFGCLPNHIVGKGMIRVIKEHHPEANIVAVDYDPGATRINQENRIKLMLSNAKKTRKPENKHIHSAKK